MPQKQPSSVKAAPITGVISPVAGNVPSTAINSGSGYTAELIWNDNPATFAYSTAYTATITLTAEAGYRFSTYTDTGQIAGFTVNGIAPVWVSNDGVTLVFTVTFPETEMAPAKPASNGSIILWIIIIGSTLIALGVFSVLIWQKRQRKTP